METKEKKPALEIALGQIDVQAGRPDINAERIIEESISAYLRGINVIVFPEMCLPGYLIGDMHNNEEFVRDVLSYHLVIQSALSMYDIVVIFGSYGVGEAAVNENGRLRLYNAAYVFHQGRQLCNLAGFPLAIKTLHPNYRIFDDARYFYCLRKLSMELGEPLQDLLKPFKVTIKDHDYQLGIMLCEDMWDIDYAQKPARILKDNGAEVLFNLSFSNWSWQKNRKRHQVVRDLLKDIKLPMVYVNGVGCQNNGKNFIPFDGSSTVYNRDGEIVCIAEMYQDTVLDVTLSDAMVPIKLPTFSDVAQMYEGIVVATRGKFRATHPQYRQKIVIGLSGGIDSALSAAFFCKLVGSENVILVNMPYKDYNSEATKDIAAEIATNLWAEYRIVPIDDMVDADAKTNGIKEGTPQHKTIQAAMRFKVLASVASQTGGMIICNANKTEIAFGYGTLIGDLRGYFAPWADCLKGEVYQLADYMNLEVYGWEVIPRECIDIPPMDELTRDGGGERKDPFDYGHVGRVGYHDAMVRSLTEVQVGPEWFLKHYWEDTLEEKMLLPAGRVSELFPTPDLFIDDLEEKLSWFVGAIHKRVQSVPAAHISRSAFGWDYREYLRVMADDYGNEVKPYYSRSYQELKARLVRSF